MTNKKFELKELCVKCIDDLMINKRSDNTVKNYQVTYNHLLSLLNPEEETWMTTKEFERFILKYLKILSEKFEAPKTLNAKRTHLRQLVSFAYAKGYINKDFSGAIGSIKEDRGKEKSVLTAEDIEKILNIADSDIENARGFETFLKIRNRFLFIVFLWTGARISEVRNLKWSDINTVTNEIKLFGKGNNTRIIPLTDDFVMQILRYRDNLRLLKENGIVNVLEDKYVFKSTKPGSKGEVPMTSKAIYNILNDFFVRANIDKRITPHSLRHTFASFGIKNNMSLTVLSKILGHSTPRVTAEVYAHIIDKKQMREEMQKITFK